jgi:hypothetical protein
LNERKITPQPLNGKVLFEKESAEKLLQTVPISELVHPPMEDNLQRRKRLSGIEDLSVKQWLRDANKACQMLTQLREFSPPSRRWPNGGEGSDSGLISRNIFTGGSG